MKKLLFVSILFFFVLFLSGCEGFMITSIDTQDTAITITDENTTIDITTDTTEIEARISTLTSEVAAQATVVNDLATGMGMEALI